MKYSYNVKKYHINTGIDLYIMKSNKFKSILFNVAFIDDLTEQAAQNSLIPGILSQGSTSYPNTASIQKYLDELYGASFNAGAFKIGETMIYGFNSSFLSDKYVTQNEKLLPKIAKLMRDIIYNPTNLNENGFSPEYFRIEKENHLNFLQSIINDKMQYAQLRCIEEMFENELYGNYQYGKIENIQNLTNKECASYYKNILENKPIVITIAGDVNEEETFNVIKENFDGKRENVLFKQTFENPAPIENVRVKHDKMNVEQGRLVLGYRTQSTFRDETYYNSILFNQIFGGGAHSKLFKYFREEAGLAYYVFTQYEATKGAIFLLAGINPVNYKESLEVIKEQLNNIRIGKITNEEFDRGKELLKSKLRSILDSQAGMINHMLVCEVNNRFADIDEGLSKIDEISREDVAKQAELVTLDTVYFLGNSK